MSKKTKKALEKYLANPEVVEFALLNDAIIMESDGEDYTDGDMIDIILKVGSLVAEGRNCDIEEYLLIQESIEDEVEKLMKVTVSEAEDETQIKDDERGRYIPIKGELAWFWQLHSDLSGYSGVTILARYASGGEEENYVIEEFDNILFSDCAKFEGVYPKHIQNSFEKRKK